ncbi:MAG: hypothetical protein ACRD0U_17345 [Acidimicrobiales bacterium]
MPHVPGPLISLEARAGRPSDDLDELVDELFPDTDERPGWFDAVLAAGGGALATWAFLAGASTALVVVGLVGLALGCILPARSAWHWVRAGSTRRRREKLVTAGVSMQVTEPVTIRLVDAYEQLVPVAEACEPGLQTAAVAAAHGALMEAATLLAGRGPASDAEREYIAKRASAIEELTRALRPPAASPPDPAALVEAREEVDELDGLNSLSRLEELTTEARNRDERG